jgi:general secretion pathway protein B
MSYILDALRKSEQERQIASGSGAGLLFPASPEQPSGAGRKVLLLGVAALIVTMGMNWWSWSQLSPPAKTTPASNTLLPQATLSTPPISATPAPSSQNHPRMQVGEALAGPASSTVPEKKPAIVAASPAEKASRKDSADQAPPPLAVNAPRNEAPSEVQKVLPPINVSGFIKDETAGNLAIINDKLVREGGEISPGLRLEKIDGEHAVFNYKGQRFRR